MKNFVLKSVVLAAAAVVWSGAGYAETVLRFSIPFAFSSGGQYLASGEYTVRCDSKANTVIFERKGEGVQFLTPGTPGETSPESVPWLAKLRFHKYGDRYYLRAFQRAGEASREWKPSRAERESAKFAAGQEVAVLFH